MQIKEALLVATVATVLHLALMLAKSAYEGSFWMLRHPHVLKSVLKVEALVFVSVALSSMVVSKIL